MPLNDPTRSRARAVQQGRAKRPTLVIDKTEPRKEFSGPATFQGTGSFSGNGFKAKDAAR